MRLGDYLTVRREWDWVKHDCSRWLDGWLVVRGRGSAMNATDIHYSSAISADRVIKNGGGLLKLWENGMNAIGVHEVSGGLKEGDMAIIDIPTEDGTHQTCGIWTGSKWASCHIGGLMFGYGHPLRMWAI